MTPCGISPVVTRRQSAINSLRASATIIVLRVAPRASAVRARYHWAKALSFWNIRKRQANCSMPRRTRALPARANPFSRRREPLSSGVPVSPPPAFAGAGSPRHRPAVAQISRQDLLDQHVGRLDANAVNLRQQADHRVRAFVRVLLQALATRHLDLADLFGEEAQLRHLALQLGQRVGRQRRPFGGAQSLEPVRRRA